MAQKKKKKWSEVPENEGFQFINEAGKFTFLVTEAWDSLLAPDGTYDADMRKKYPDIHYLGFLCKVVAPESSAQVGRYYRLKLNTHTDKTQAQTKTALVRAFNMEFNPELGPDDPLSVSECVGRHITMLVEAEPGRDDPNKTYYTVAPWDIFAPPEELANSDRRELYADPENEMSVKHYAEELERARKKQKGRGDASSEGAANPDDDGIPW